MEKMYRRVINEEAKTFSMEEVDTFGSVLRPNQYSPDALYIAFWNKKHYVMSHAEAYSFVPSYIWENVSASERVKILDKMKSIDDQKEARIRRWSY